MISALEQEPFFTSEERASLRTLGLPDGESEAAAREAFGGLMLSTLISVSVADGATSSGEFEEIEDFIRRLENEFELATKENLESVGTNMGFVPFIKGSWGKEHFQRARGVLASALERIAETDAHHVRNELAKSVLKVAKASGGLLHLHNLHKSEVHVLHELVEELKLDQCAEGLHLIGKMRTV
jgi:hypothetical protein